MANKQQQESKKGRPSSAGRRKGKFEFYSQNTMERKLRHVLKRNGSNAAAAYIRGYSTPSLLQKIARESTFAGERARMALKAA